MAEFIFKNMVKSRGLERKFNISSAATSTEEIGNGIHHGTRRKLKEMNIPFSQHYAVQITPSDYRRYDYIIGMDSNNMRNMIRIFGSDPEHKLSRLLDLTENPRDVADPWYTGNFDETYDDISLGCKALLDKINIE